MLSLNSKNTFLPSLVNKPRIGFDADYYKLFFRNTDVRSKVSIEYILNTKVETVSPGVYSYELPEIDREYLLKYTVKPENSNLREYSGEMNIFKNSVNCRYFNYGDVYESTHIKEYRGTLSNIVIPTKHNLVNTLSAELLEFPNVSSNTIQITTPKYMTNFNIRDVRITKFDILSENFQPIEGQFKDLVNLGTVSFASLLMNCPDYLFYNCPKVSINPNITKNITTLGTMSFYNTPSQKSIRFAGNTLESGVFDYPNEGVQKAIFTSADSINGLTNKDIPYGTFTGGMLYNDNKKHQIYCGVTDSVWRDGPALNSEVLNKGYNQSTSEAPDKTFVFRPVDENVFGLDIVVYDENGKEINHTQEIHEPGDISLLDSYIYGKDMTATDLNDIRYKVDSAVSFYDKFHLTTIDSTGLMETTIQGPYGKISPAPKYRLRYLFNCQGSSLDDLKTFELTCGTYSFTVEVPRNKVYDYILCDNNNTDVCMVRNTMREAVNQIDLGRNNKAVQHPKLTLIKDFGGYGLYQFDATEYYTYSIYTDDGGTASAWPPMMFFYRDYKYGYVNERKANWAGATSTTRVPQAITSTEPEFEKWYDIWFENGKPSTRVKHILWTTEDNSTVYVNGEVYATNVPKYRIYFKYDNVAPALRFCLTLVKGPFEEYPTYTEEEIWFDKRMSTATNIGYIDLLDYATEEELKKWISNTYYKLSPKIRYGYADGDTPNDWLFVNGVSYAPFNFLSGNSFTKAILEYTE